MHYIREQDVEGDRIGPPHQRVIRHLVTPETMGSQHLWLGTSSVDPGFKSNAHAHDDQEEVFYCAAGKGRIIVFGDSTLISNFFIFIPGKPELMLGMVEFANREERFPGWRMFLTIVGGFALFIGFITAGSFGARGFVWMLAIGAATFLASASIIEKSNRDNYPLPEPREEYKQLVFEGEYSRYFIPELRLANNQDKDFHTFFVWTQRVGVYPRKYH